MDFPPFASLGHVRILVVPVGNIKKHSFDRWASIIRTFESMRLGDIPPDGRDDRARFMPSPLSTGHLHLSFPSHPPPTWHSPLALLRPSETPLGVIGIAECPTSSSLSSTLAQFNAEMTHLFPPNSLFPLAQNCYIFEDGDGSSTLNLGDSSPGMVVIPSVMGNKELYIGTLVAELCSNILGEFANLARTVESTIGMESLNANLFPTIASFSDQRIPFDSPTSSRQSLPSSPSVSANGIQADIGHSRSSTPTAKRASTFDASRPVVPTRNASLAAAVASKSVRRQSGISVPPTGRLFKLLGDLFLLAGRSSDAGVWYGESLSLLKSPQDTIWLASALEGLCTVQVLEAWTAGHGIHTSFSNEGREPWLDISEKLTQATALYSRATPLVGSLSPDVDSSLIILLLSTCICRHTALLFSIWASKGWGPLAFTTLIRAGLPPAFTPTPPTESHRVRMSAITGITRSQIAGTLAQAHGPFLLHLEPHDRIRLLQHMATTYSCLGFRRKEVYVLRELLSTVMDVLVCSRDEVIRKARERGSGTAAPGSGLGISDLGGIGFRESESADGNESIIRLVKYVCEVYGVDLGAVKVVGPEAQGKVEVGIDEELGEHKLRYGWDELQLGVVREAVAIVEALPDYSTVAQFDLSALRALHTIIGPSDQAYLYSNSAKALVTARRRGDDRRVEYWSGNPVVSVEIIPLPFVRLPVEHRAKDLLPPSEEASVVVGKRDPFIYNPRLLSSKSKAQAIVVQNEPIEFILTLQNPYAFDLELQSLSLSTSGVSLETEPLVVTIPANSFQVTRIVGNALQPGTLVVRGCLVQAHGGTSREFVLPLATDQEESTREKRKSAWNAEVGRIKESGLDARPWIRDKRMSIVKAKAARSTKTQSEMSFLECNVVLQQPLMRIRRTSLTHGAVMMYDGETSTIRLTVENVSTIPIEFIKVTCVDSTMAPAQQALAEGEMSVFETYEMEYELLHRPVFRWDSDKEPKAIGPGKKAILTITCSGKVGCTSGTIQISYSNIRKESLMSSDIFHTRQVLYPVLVTVYNTLECHSMDILPFSSLAAAESKGIAEAEREGWKRTLEGVEDEDGEWCLFTVDVRNTYGMPFEVTFERDQTETPAGMTARLVAPGSTSRIILPVKRFLLPESKTSEPIPTLSDRQFIVSKSNLTSREERHQRELFWYREELFNRVKGRWREAGGSRFGWLSLRQQRFTAPMLDALRTDHARLRLILVGYGDEADAEADVLSSQGGRSTAQPNQFVYLRTTLINLSPEPLILTMTLTLNPSEHVLYDGVLSDIPVGKLESGEEREIEFGICFVSEGRFDLRAEAWVVGRDVGEDAKAGEGELRVFVRNEQP